MRLANAALMLALLAGSVAGADPGRPEDPRPAQVSALARLKAFDGLWRGPATVLTPTGQTLQLVQTERVGPMLGATLRVIEGRGHLSDRGDGPPAFNAFAVISFDPRTNKYNFRSHAHGYAGDFPLEVTDDGFRWEMPAGPATMRYAATVKDGVWSETGERVIPGQPPVRIFEMRLKRVGDTDWPAAGAIGPR